MGGDSERVQGFAGLGIRRGIQLAGQALRLLDPVERGADAVSGFPLVVFLVPLSRPAERNLGLLEVTARIAEIVVVEAHPRVEQLTTRLGQIDPLSRVVQGGLNRSSPGSTPRIAEPYEDDENDESDQSQLSYSSHGLNCSG